MAAVAQQPQQPQQGGQQFYRQSHPHPVHKLVLPSLYPPPPPCTPLIHPTHHGWQRLLEMVQARLAGLPTTGGSGTAQPSPAQLQGVSDAVLTRILVMRADEPAQLLAKLEDLLRQEVSSPQGRKGVGRGKEATREGAR